VRNGDDGPGVRPERAAETAHEDRRAEERQEQASSGYPPIADYAVIGDTRSVALISRAGSIDWLCWPRFGSRSLFGALLDWQRGGHFSVAPAGPFTVTRRYVEGTNVLETTFTTAEGTARLTDLMPVMTEAEKARRLSPFRELLRRIEVLRGEITMTVDYSPRPDYGRDVPVLRTRAGCIACDHGPTVTNLRSDAPLVIDGDRARATFTLRAGERRDFALAFDSHGPAVFPEVGDAATRQIDDTILFWRQWAATLTYDGPYRDMVLRSALTLKLLTYAPTGAIVAAPTTSLPEKVGGIRNWDYRYCWLRDASFTVAALDDCGFEAEGGAFVGWLLYATQLTHPHLQILYDVFGESRLPERTLAHLEGYRGSAPVRIGNDARKQFQLDVYGEVLGAVEEHLERCGKLDSLQLTVDVRRLLVRLADQVVKRWREPDNGIWEKRSGLQHHVHAKVMAWAALDAAERLAREGNLTRIDTSPWRQAKEEIRAEVLARGFNARLNSFVSILDGEELDASLLYLARVGFLPGDDPRLVGTLEAIRGQLGSGELLYRYDVVTDDGLPPGEGAFLACSFWMVEALALAGRHDEARRCFEALLTRANDVGLYSEEIDVESGALLGNFPQALTHIGLLNAALRLQSTRPVTADRDTSSATAAAPGSPSPASAPSPRR
jgi:GH15 family glucan-1,4-alpha-glucosidase